MAAAYPSWWRDPIVKDGTHEGGTGYLWGPPDVPDRDVKAAVNIAHGIPYRLGIPPVPRLRSRGPRRTGGRVFSLALLAGGLGTWLTWDDHPLGTSLQTGLSCALVVFGLGMAISAFAGRTGSRLDHPGGAHGGAPRRLGGAAEGHRHPLGADDLVMRPRQPRSGRATTWARARGRST